MEASALEIKSKHGGISPQERERQVALQAKMELFWREREEAASARPSLLAVQGLFEPPDRRHGGEHDLASPSPLHPFHRGHHQELPVIQRLTELWWGFDDESWCALKDQISKYNKLKDVGLFHRLCCLQKIDKGAEEYKGGKSEKMPAIRKEVAEEIEKLLEFGEPLSGAAQAANQELGILKPIHLSNLRGNLVGKSKNLLALAGKLPKLTGPQEAFLFKAVAAGARAGDLEVFANKIQGMEVKELLMSLSPVPEGGESMVQQYADFCSTTTVVIVRAMFDPIYALELRENNKDISAPMLSGLHDPKELEKALKVYEKVGNEKLEKEKSDSKEEVGDEKKFDKKANNFALLMEQWMVSKTFSTDVTERVGLNPQDRVVALNDIQAYTGLVYVLVHVSGYSVQLKVNKKKSKKEELSGKKESIEEKESISKISSLIETFDTEVDIKSLGKGPDESRLKGLGDMLVFALSVGAPVGCGIGGHAQIFVDVEKNKLILYDPSRGDFTRVDKKDIDSGAVGIDFLTNLAIPKIGNESYQRDLEKLVKLGAVKSTYNNFVDDKDVESKKEIAEKLAISNQWKMKEQGQFLEKLLDSKFGKSFEF